MVCSIEYVYDRCPNTGAVVARITKQLDREFQFTASNGKFITAASYPEVIGDTVFLRGLDESCDNDLLFFETKKDFEECFVLPVREYNESKGADQ